MKNPEIPSEMRRIASELFEAQLLMSQLQHLCCTSADLWVLIQSHTKTLELQIAQLALKQLFACGVFTTWACHACGGDGTYHADCRHCGGEGYMTVDDVVEMVVK